MGDRPQGLAPFLAALAERLDALDADELRAAVLGHAEQLGPRERAPFLARFAAPRSGPPDEPALCADVTAFVDRLRSGAYFDGWGWDDDLHEERAWGDESWVGEIDALFSRAAEAFLAGDLAPAAEAYGALLEALTLDGEVGTFSGPGTPESMVDTDLGEAKARALRARYETTDPGYRAAILDEQMVALEYVGPAIGLQEIADARPGALDGVAEFLDEWIALLTPPGDGRRRRALLTEAVRRRDGVDGLAALARGHGRDTPELFEGWIDALEGPPAAAACREALAALGPQGEVRARIAERLAADDALEGRREAWRAAPTMLRLRGLAAAAQAGGDPDAVLREEADRLEAGAPMPGRLAAALLALDRRVDGVMAMLRAAPPLGWSRRDHPGPVAVALALLLALDTPAEAAERAPTVWSQVRRLDLDLPGLTDPMWWDDEDRPPDDRQEPPALSVLLSAATARVDASASQRVRWMELTTAAVVARAAAIVEAKRRGAYERAADLMVACAEARCVALDPQEGAALVRKFRGRYPRHVAFRSALDAATRRSPLLPTPPPRR